ncbi:hypothetical protein CC79DRAFT_914547 [Sarocladium strictum]
MAAIPPARTRSLRGTAPALGRSHLQQSSNASTTTATRNGGQAAAAAAAASASQNGPSPLSLFLTNLRLLDLDLLPDWPGISAATFTVTGSGTGAALAQKKRVGCVEWALFRLFEIYDAEETRTKLKPYFPPLEQVQSVNLRAALLRGLEAAKKSGVLGKDTILRKTMLDDCRGERLEEVLAAFSTAVLKMVVAEEESAGATPVMRLALENRGYQDDKTDLMVLTLAHRKALTKTLNDRKIMSAKYNDFQELLRVKERGITRRREEVKALEDVEKGQNGKTVSQDAVKEMRRTVRNNWAGNEQWMDALLYGDAKSGADSGSLFGMPFERVWRRVEQSRLDELEEGGTSLLEQLERRVRGHEERLAKWERFRDALRGAGNAPERTKARVEEHVVEKNGLEFEFGAHESLRVGKPQTDQNDSLDKSSRLGAAVRQDKFMEDLERDLEQASTTDPDPVQTLSFLFNRQPAPRPKDMLEAPDTSYEATSEISDLEEEDAHEAHLAAEEEHKPIAPRHEGLKRFPVRPKISYPIPAIERRDVEDEEEAQAVKKDSGFRNAPKLPRPQRKVSYEQGSQDAPRALPSRTRTTSSSRSRVYSRSRSISPEKYQAPQPPKTAPLPTLDMDHGSKPDEEERIATPHEEEVATLPQDESISPTQDLADEILESMKNASPSPAKPRHKLSLADRTRMSMARGSLLFAEEDEEPDIPNHQKDMPTSSTPTDADPEPSPAEDLASRTRRSMAGFEKARQKAQLDRRRSIRKSKAMGPPIKEGSYFPKVEEEGDGGSVLAEELMGEEDMEAVFKSRPKIMASPLPSPTREWDE